MLVIIFIILVIVIIKIVGVKKTSASGRDFRISVRQVPQVFEQLQEQNQNGSFAVFIFNPKGQPLPEDTVNLQFSIEDSQAGFDWVLLTQRNISDELRFRELAESAGHTVVPREGNGVHSLRVEGDDLPAFCLSLMQELYDLSTRDTIYLLVDGFDWRQ